MQVVHDISFRVIAGVIASTVHEKMISNNVSDIYLNFLLHAFTLLPPKDN